jgi:glycosyltransferase involved in cell wall biosynthesis
MRKKRILIVNEFSELMTGFSTYMHYVLPRLYNTGKYEIAEHAIYTSPLHPKIMEVPWKVYPNEPDPRDQRQVEFYNRDKLNQFGKWKLEEICLDFKPDIVIDIRDIFMSDWILRSPYRKYFKFIHMTTCDGEPQKPDWIDSYKQCDKLLTYSYWAKNLLEKENVKVDAVASPGTDLDIFIPRDKKKIRNEVGLDENLFIIQTVMRNQPRKLFPDLFRVLSKYLKLCEENNNQDLAKRTFLYCHTTYPDLGWDLSLELRRYGVSHKVLFTYMCDKCGSVYPSFYCGERSFCKSCGDETLRFPNTSVGVSRENLSRIMSLSDLYVQYSICLTKGQKILTKNGWKPIEEIMINDTVLTHSGSWKNVKQTFINNKGNRKIYKISVRGDFETLECTEEHPIYSINKSDINDHHSVRSKIGSLLRSNKTLPDPEWTRCKDLKSGSLLVKKINTHIFDIDKIDITNYLDSNINFRIKDRFIISNNTDSIPQFIEIDNEFCKFLGLIVADGCWLNNNMFKITSHVNELENIKLSESIISKICNKPNSTRIYKNRKAIDIIGYSKILTNFFKNNISKYENKKLPDWALTLPYEKQKYILQGLFMGDGYLKEDKVSVYVTTSINLCNQIKCLLERNNIIYNVHIDKKLNQKDSKNRKIQYRFEVPGNIANGKFITKINNSSSIYINDCLYRTIKNVEEIEYNDNVYNIEVEHDNSFTTPIASVHNCEGWGMAINDAKSCGVPTMSVDYSAMIEQNYNGGAFPIPIKRFFQESIGQTGQLRAFPDDDITAKQIFDFANLSNEKREEIGKEARECVEKHYNWDNIAKIWESVIDSITIDENMTTTWLSNKNPILPTLQIPNNLDNCGFVHWCYLNIIKRPDLINSYLVQKTIAALNAGYESAQDEHGRPIRIPIDRNRILQSLFAYVQNFNEMEELRYRRLVKQETNHHTLQNVEV